MNKKLRALINPKQIANMKAAGFKLIDVKDSGDYTTSTKETTKIAVWETNLSGELNGPAFVTVEMMVHLPADIKYILERVYAEGVERGENTGRIRERSESPCCCRNP